MICYHESLQLVLSSDSSILPNLDRSDVCGRLGVSWILGFGWWCYS